MCGKVSSAIDLEPFFSTAGRSEGAGTGLLLLLTCRMTWMVLLWQQMMMWISMHRTTMSCLACQLARSSNICGLASFRLATANLPEDDGDQGYLGRVGSR